MENLTEFACVRLYNAAPSPTQQLFWKKAWQQEDCWATVFSQEDLEDLEAFFSLAQDAKEKAKQDGVEYTALYHNQQVFLLFSEGLMRFLCDNKLAFYLPQQAQQELRSRPLPEVPFSLI